MSAITAICALAAERLERTGSWWIDTTELERLIDPVALYRALYELRLVGLDRVDARNCGQLVTLLERMGDRTAEQQLRSCGLFLNHSDRIELMEMFVRSLRVKAASHVTDLDAFRAMLRDARGFDGALALYASTFVGCDLVLLRCAEQFAERRAGSAASRHTAEIHLRELLERKIVVLWELLPALLELLQTVALQSGYLRRGRPAGPQDADSGGERRPGHSADRRAEALRLLGFDRPEPSPAELRRSYRALMRRYHPDVNPDGLELTKKINSAYALLLSSTVG